MMRRRDPEPSLSEQVGERLRNGHAKKPPPAPGQVVSTGSTLLDLAISGGVYERGGVPGGILVEAFGPNSAGKTVLLCELAGGVQRAGGEVMFADPEGRLNAQFAKLFDFKVENARYDRPDTVTALFEPIRKWEPKAEGISGIFADSLAALSTDMEMDKGDKMGQRRAKEFSEECRKVCRVLANRNLLMVCSNQVRQNVDAGPYGERFKSPGGEAIGFYASLRLRFHSPEKLYRERSVGGKDVKRVVGIRSTVDCYKNSIDAPYRSAPLFIGFDYGVDDVQANLSFVKTSTGSSVYQLNGHKLGASLERAIKVVEDEGLEAELRDKTIEVWRDVESKFKVERRAKVRT